MWIQYPQVAFGFNWSLLMAWRPSIMGQTVSNAWIRSSKLRSPWICSFSWHSLTIGTHPLKATLRVHEISCRMIMASMSVVCFWSQFIGRLSQVAWIFMYDNSAALNSSMANFTPKRSSLTPSRTILPKWSLVLSIVHLFSAGRSPMIPGVCAPQR